MSDGVDVLVKRLEAALARQEKVAAETRSALAAARTLLVKVK